MTKDADAYRTIGEVAEALSLPQHVLRFWETKLPQIDPLKRGGGRRYYRPEQVVLIGRIKDLLYRDGYTIKGVQRLLRTHGIKDVIANGASASVPVRPSVSSLPEPAAASLQLQDLASVTEVIEQCRQRLAEARAFGAT